MLVQRLQFYRSVLLLSDALVIAATWIAAYFIRFHLPLIAVTKGVPPFSLYLKGLILVEVIWLTTFYFTGLYKVTTRNTRQLMVVLARAEVVAFLTLIAITWFTHRQTFSRIVFLFFFVLSYFALAGARMWLKRRFVLADRPGFKVRTLIVGVGELGERTAERLCLRPELGVEVVGFLAERPDQAPPQVCDRPVLGGYEELDRIIGEMGVGLVFIALPLESQHRLGEIIASITNDMVDVKVVPDLGRFMALRSSIEELDGLPIVSLRESPMHGWNQVLKRALDIAVAVPALIISSPIMLLAAIAIKLTSKGPVLYRQERMGLDGQIFNMAKFRTMRVDAEEKTGPVWAKRDDPRRTLVGRFLRRFSIDELPQLVHVLKGEMSLVGPRPERPEFIEQFKTRIPKYMARHKMKAGMTGLAQVKGYRGNTSIEGRIEYDLEYIKNWSVGLDLKIMARTIWLILVDRNAY